LERYLVDETDKAIDGEESPFLKATLRTATGLISQEGVSILFHGDTHTGRDSLLTHLQGHLTRQGYQPVDSDQRADILQRVAVDHLIQS